jgi:hypothetical protein
MKHAKEKSQRISEAVFRGKKINYNFDVFPFNFEFEETSGVFIISRRTLDKIGKGHHKFMCIGQTESLAKELKKHKKLCVKKQKSIVVCLLAQPDEKKRLQIESDIKSVYTIPCLH